MLSTQRIPPVPAAPGATKPDATPADKPLEPSSTAQRRDHTHTGSSCVVCEQLAGSDRRYFGRLFHDRRSRQTLAQSIATSMGFCADHSTIATSYGATMAEAWQTTVDEAARHLASLLERTDLQDELIQDILFGARGRCPACGYRHRAEGRALTRVLRGAEQAQRIPLPPLCFVHTEMLVRRAESPLRGRLLRKLRLDAKTARTALSADPHGTNGINLALQVLYPFGDEALPLAATASACPICEAIATAGRQWLDAASENVRLEQPGWITLPTCTRHLLQCLDHPDSRLRRAALDRYLDAALPPRASPAPADTDAPKRRRRGRTRWFDAIAASRGQNGTAPAPGSLPKEPCPGCDAQEIAERRAIAALIRKTARAGTDEAVADATSGLCLKHFAEALIYASDPRIEHRLSRALCAALRVDPRRDAVAG